jgi:hypothetical protein
MKYEKLKDFSAEEFRRLTGIKKTSFDKIVGILTEAEREKKKAGGKPNKLIMEDRLLMMLEYLREYRTYFHVASSYGISESACYRIIKWIEDILIKHPDFSLPGRKALLKNDMNYEVMLVDATETPIERPKKNRNISILEKRKDTH